jgi:hypothetical protein
MYSTGSALTEESGYGVDEIRGEILAKRQKQQKL